MLPLCDKDVTEPKYDLNLSDYDSTPSHYAPLELINERTTIAESGE